MPGTYTYPGVYVEEVPSGVRPIVGVSTSDTAFVDVFARGPLDRAVRVTSWDDFERRFGGLDSASEASYAIAQYYLNGGSIAWVVRVAGDPAPVAAGLVLPGGSPDQDVVLLRAKTPGAYGTRLQVAIDWQARDPNEEFNLVVREVETAGGRQLIRASEVHRNLRLSDGQRRSVRAVLAAESELLVADWIGAGDRPAETLPGGSVTTPEIAGDPADEADAFRVLGSFDDDGTTVVPTDGGPPDQGGLIGGLDALKVIAPSIFNILCLPAAATLSHNEHADVIEAATKLCEDKRAFLIVDPPDDVDTLDDLTGDGGWLPEIDPIRHRNAAVYFPRVTMSDPLDQNRPREVGPSGTVAGVIATTDSTRGPWKAPAGTDARLVGADIPAKLSDLENGGLNPLGINVLRTFPLFGNVVWGARTLEGSDQQASEWKYVPVRRTALFIEESLFQALKWVVFEPNDEPLWSQIRLNVGAFMNGLFRQGAFQGATPAEAYFVRCDSDTTTQADIDRGIVNILVGFAPLKPAEFVVIRLQQMAGQIDT
jgi:Bacteriophage tail sheath protein